VRGPLVEWVERCPSVADDGSKRWEFYSVTGAVLRVHSTRRWNPLYLTTAPPDTRNDPRSFSLDLRALGGPVLTDYCRSVLTAKRKAAALLLERLPGLWPKQWEARYEVLRWEPGAWNPRKGVWTPVAHTLDAASALEVVLTGGALYGLRRAGETSRYAWTTQVPPRWVEGVPSVAVTPLEPTRAFELYTTARPEPYRFLATKADGTAGWSVASLDFSPPYDTLYRSTFTVEPRAGVAYLAGSATLPVERIVEVTYPKDPP